LRCAAFFASAISGAREAKKLSLLLFDSFRRRIAKHAIKTALGEHLWEFKRPMEGASMPGNVLCSADQRAIHGAAGDHVPDMCRGRIIMVLRFTGTPPVLGIRKAAV
jgi:hypothetical protein